MDLDLTPGAITCRRFAAGGVVQPNVRVAALEDGVLRVSALVDDIPQIAELDCNPFVVHEQGATILDARVRVAAVDPRPLLGVRS